MSETPCITCPICGESYEIKQSEVRLDAEAKATIDRQTAAVEASTASSDAYREMMAAEHANVQAHRAWVERYYSTQRRCELAGKAMQALLSNSAVTLALGAGETDMHGLMGSAVAYADALLARLGEP